MAPVVPQKSVSTVLNLFTYLLKSNRIFFQCQKMVFSFNE